MKHSSPCIRLPYLSAVLALFVAFAVGSVLIKSTLILAFEGSALCEDIALDGDASGDSELLCPEAESAIHLPPFRPRPGARPGDGAVRNLNQPPATPPPIPV